MFGLGKAVIGGIGVRKPQTSGSMADKILGGAQAPQGEMPAPGGDQSALKQALLQQEMQGSGKFGSYDGSGIMAGAQQQQPVQQLPGGSYNGSGIMAGVGTGQPVPQMNQTSMYPQKPMYPQMPQRGGFGYRGQQPRGGGFSGRFGGGFGGFARIADMLRQRGVRF